MLARPRSCGLAAAGLTPYLVKAVQEIASISGTFRDNLVAWLGDAGVGGRAARDERRVTAVRGEDFVDAVAALLCGGWGVGAGGCKGSDMEVVVGSFVYRELRLSRPG